MKLRLLFAVVCTMWIGVAGGQTTIFSENMGTPSGNVLVANHTFQNSGSLSYSSSPNVDVRTTNPSINPTTPPTPYYSGASGSGNVFITNTSGLFFEISGINTASYTNLSLTLGHHKSTSSTWNNDMVIEVSSDGVTYSPLSFTRPSSATWALVSPTGVIPSTSNLRIRFRQTATTNQFRIDDVTLSGMVAGFITDQNGDWNTATTWINDVLPGPGDNVIVAHNVTSAAAITRNAGTTTTVNSTGTLTMTNAPYYNYGATTINGTFETAGLSGGIYIYGGSTFLVNQELRLNPGGFVQTGSPIYGNASTLTYNNGGTFGRGLEWSHTGIGTIGVTPGYPNNVTLQNSTTFDYRNNGTPLAKAIHGNLFIQTGSAFYMDYGLATSGGPLTIGGKLDNRGIFKLGYAGGDDLHIAGDFINAGTFDGNNRAVVFKGNTTQTITSAAALTIPYIVFSSTGSRTVTVATPTLTVSAPLAGNAISFGSASDILDLNGKNLIIGTAGVANTISGAGTFRGWNTTAGTAGITLRGTGSVGTMNFTSGFNNFASFTIDRQAAVIGVSLGSDLTVNTTLGLTNGLIEVGANRVMTLGPAINITGAGSGSYVIAEFSSYAYLRKNVSSTGSHLLPIGDSPSSDNGAQYSPAKFIFSSAPSGSVSAAVEDLKHPNLDATLHHITRYWSTGKTGTIPTYTFEGTYLPVDVVGTDLFNMQSNQWNGTSWTNSGTIITAANTLSIGTSTFGATNHFTAGLRNADINIYQGTVANNANSVSYTFPGTVLVGNSATITFTIQNVGQTTLNMGAATFSGAPFTTGFVAGNISAGGSTYFTVTFTPTANGTFSGTLSIPSNDPDESPYIVNFTGTGLVPAPEMNVRGNSGGGNNIADGSVTTNGLNNTQWAPLAIGNSAAKDYRIENLGQLTLNLTGTPIVTIGGANPGDFTVTTQPATASVAAGGFTTFIVTFTPQAAGVRNAVVSISNNDSDENPYDFVIQGTGTCPAISITALPLSGPASTVVTINSATNLTGATATFNGIAAVVTPVSASQIKVTVPAGATSGPLSVTTSQGCVTSVNFTVIDTMTGNCQGGNSTGNLFISEVTDATHGGLTYVEIYNATGAAVNLGSYSLRFAFNGGGYQTPINLNNVSLANNDAYVVSVASDGLCTSPGGDGSYADQSSTAAGINFVVTENDHIGLFQSGTIIDAFGVVGSDDWADGLGLGDRGATFRRKNTVLVPSTVFSTSDWDITDWAGTGASSCATNDYSDMGAFNFMAGTPPTVTQQPSYAPTCAGTSLTVAATEGYAGGNALAYQWFYTVAPSTTWTAVSDGGVYSGGTSATLNILDVSGLIGYQFYVQVRENGANCYSASNAVMITNAGTSTWNGTWSPAPPTSNTIAIIAGNYNTASHGSFESCNLTVNAGASLTIGGNTYVSVQNNLTVNSTGTLLILDDGSLVQVNDSGTVTNSGTMQVMRTTSPYNKFDYTYWSSPVAAAVIGTTFTGWRTDYAFQFVTANYADLVAPFDGFDDNNNAWVYTPPATIMTKGKGYAIMAPTTGSFPATSTVTFSGAVNNGIVTVPLTLSGNTAATNDDFNLVGNPYPSAISADAFITANPSFAGTLYFWTHRTGISNTNPGPDANNFITADYAMYNMTGGTSSSGTGSPVPNGFVASGQGFFIDANTATSVVFNNSMRSRFYDNSQFFRPVNMLEAPLERDRIWLSLQHGNVLYSQQLIGFFDEATQGFDRGYDGVVNPAGNSVSFYSMMEGDRYRIQGRQPFDVADRIPLGFTTTATGNFTISIDAAEGILGTSGQPVYLEDFSTGDIHDLKQGAYTFTSQAGTFDERFVLRFADALLGTADIEPSAANFIAYAEAGTVNVKSTSDIKRLKVYDLRGRMLLDSGLIGQQSYSVDIQASRQAMIVVAELADGTTVSRRILF